MPNNLNETIETLAELKRMHQLNMELLEQLAVACDFLKKSGVPLPNASTFVSLLSKAVSLLNEIQADEPKMMQYQKLADEKKHLLRTDEDETEPGYRCSEPPLEVKPLLPLPAYL